MNMFRVSQNLYRGPRPDSSSDLITLGFNYQVATLISLETGFGQFWDSLWGRDFDERGGWERGWHRSYISRPCSNIFPPSRAETEVILRDIKRSLISGPVYVHCYAGVDRTGWVIAAWRVLEEGVHPEDAWAEAMLMGLHRRYHWWRAAFMEEIGK